ncbi:unnamed protein product [Sphagnum jensenii]|uniref:Uncharacterized protein n=1 Tax=Sphagnum jensenii TaxID=128206 RepID=A0ABP1BTH6_9BRYO
MYTSCLRFALEMFGTIYKVQMTWNPSKNKVASLLYQVLWTQLESKILSNMKKRVSAKNFHQQQNIIIGFVKNPPAISKVIMQCSPHLSNVLSNNINAEDIRNYQSQHRTEDRRLCNS